MLLIVVIRFILKKNVEAGPLQTLLTFSRLLDLTQHHLSVARVRLEVVLGWYLFDEPGGGDRSTAGIRVLGVIDDPRRVLLLEPVGSLNTKSFIGTKFLHGLVVVIVYNDNNLEIGDARQLVCLLDQHLLTLALHIVDAFALGRYLSGVLRYFLLQLILSSLHARLFSSMLLKFVIFV